MQKKRESPALKHQQQLALYAIAHVREENEREREWCPEEIPFEVETLGCTTWS